MELHQQLIQPNVFIERFYSRCEPGSQCKLNYAALCKLTISPQQDGEVQFDSRPIWIQPRMLPTLFKNNVPRTDDLLIVCSWCNKIETGNGKWQEVEEAVESLGLFELEILPKISHGMCDSCYQTVSLKLEKSKTG